MITAQRYFSSNKEIRQQDEGQFYVDLQDINKLVGAFTHVNKLVVEYPYHAMISDTCLSSFPSFLSVLLQCLKVSIKPVIPFSLRKKAR